MPKKESAAMRSMEGQAPKSDRAPKKKTQTVDTSHETNAAQRFETDAKEYADLQRQEAKLSKELKKLTALRVEGLGSDATEKMLFDKLADVQMRSSMLTGQYGALDEKFVEAAVALEDLKKKDAVAAHKLGEELIMDFVLEMEDTKKEAARAKRMKKPAMPPPLPADAIAGKGFTPLEMSPIDAGAEDDDSASLLTEIRTGSEALYTGTEIAKGTRAEAETETSAKLLEDIRAEIAKKTEPDHFMPPPPNPKLPGDSYIDAINARAKTENRSLVIKTAAEEVNAIEKRIKGKFGIDPETYAEEKKGFWGKVGENLKLLANPELRDAVRDYREALARLDKAA